jgi:hypothetical protein
VVHRDGEIGFVIDAPGHGGDGPTGDQLAKKDNRPSNGGSWDGAPDVEAEIDLLERLMKWD